MKVHEALQSLETRIKEGTIIDSVSAHIAFEGMTGSRPSNAQVVQIDNMIERYAPEDDIYDDYYSEQWYSDEY